MCILVTVGFIGLVVLLGKLMWNTEDWGKPTRSRHR